MFKIEKSIFGTQQKRHLSLTESLVFKLVGDIFGVSTKHKISKSRCFMPKVSENCQDKIDLAQKELRIKLGCERD